jgi:hypothetical protein
MTVAALAKAWTVAALAKAWTVAALAKAWTVAALAKAWTVAALAKAWTVAALAKAWTVAALAKAWTVAALAKAWTVAAVPQRAVPGKEWSPALYGSALSFEGVAEGWISQAYWLIHVFVLREESNSGGYLPASLQDAFLFSRSSQGCHPGLRPVVPSARGRSDTRGAASFSRGPRHAREPRRHRIRRLKARRSPAPTGRRNPAQGKRSAALGARSPSSIEVE